MQLQWLRSVKKLKTRLNDIVMITKIEGKLKIFKGYGNDDRNGWGN